MIRLSEAISRMYCQDEVQPKHIKEAFRLLGKSIIRVEQPDIHLEDDDDGVEEGAVDADGMDVEPLTENSEGSQVNGHATPSAPSAPTDSEPQLKKKPGFKMTYEEYTQIANILILYIRRQEDRSESEDGDRSVRRSQLIQWYLEEMEGEIDSEAELLERKTIVEKIIYRLIHHDRVLIQLDHMGLKTSGHSEEERQVVEDDPILIVHPNYVINP
jgi:DNA replication licensing factor MCM6